MMFYCVKSHKNLKILDTFNELLCQCGQFVLRSSIMYCVVPENIHTPPPPTEDHWKFQGGGGTNIKVLSLLFTEYPFSLPSHAGNTFVIGFMFYRCLLGIVTHKNCDETRVLPFPFLATWLVKLLSAIDVHETQHVGMCQ